MSASPTLRLERSLLRAGAATIAGMDEVGRGALSGPVSVGVVVMDARSPALPGVRDSKLLTATARELLVPRIRAWACASSVGHASPAEIDDLGIIGALRLAALRALAVLDTSPQCILLDGSHDWLSPAPQGSLFEEPVEIPPVTTRVKADLHCTSVAAASVLAKTERDAIMAALDRDHPEYGWAENKGYASPEHIAALRRRGASPIHRRSWRLPGLAEGDTALD
jgi:ribonuclease HII